jgi:cystathionine beta-lyase
VELEALTDVCHRHDVTLISDDIHADFVLNGHSYTPLADVVRTEENNHIQILSPAKSFNIPGLGLAFALIPDNSRRTVLQRKLRAMGLSKPNRMSETAVQAAYEHGTQWFKAVLAYIEKNHQFFRKEMESGLPWARVSVAEGSFLAWVDLGDSGLRHTELAYAIRHDARLMLFDGLSFGESGKYFFRFNLACSRSVLQGAVVSLVKALTAAKDRGRLEISLDSVIDKRCCG